MSGGNKAPKVASVTPQPVVNGAVEVGVRLRWHGEAAIVTAVDKSTLYLCIFTDGRRVAQNGEALMRFGSIDLDGDTSELELLEGVN